MMLLVFVYFDMRTRKNDNNSIKSAIIDARN